MSRAAVLKYNAPAENVTATANIKSNLSAWGSRPTAGRPTMPVGLVTCALACLDAEFRLVVEGVLPIRLTNLALQTTTEELMSDTICTK
jgi:hypothetical protein